MTGITDSGNFPTKGPLQSVNAGYTDVFVTKINATGSGLVHSTYVGGSGDDWGRSIADSSGNAYVTGTIASVDFPTTNPLQPAKGDNFDAFVFELDSSGSAFAYSTYLGGNDYDIGHGIAVDSSGKHLRRRHYRLARLSTKNPLQPKVRLPLSTYWIRNRRDFPSATDDSNSSKS